MLKNDSNEVRDKMEMLDSLRNIRNFLTEIKENI